MDERRNQIAGYALAIVQAMLYSTLGIFGKLLYATGLNAQQVVILRFACATVLLGAFMLVWRREALVSRQRAVYIQAVFFFVSAILYFLAVERLNAGVTTVVFYLFPVIVAAINLVVYHERISALTAGALALAVMGLVFISGVLGGAFVIDAMGMAFAISSAFAFAVYTVIIQITGRTEGALTVTLTLSWTSLLASCVVFAPVVPSLLGLTFPQIALGCVMALASTILPVVLYIQAVKRIGGTMSSLISISETPFSLVLAFFILGETIDFMEGIGIVLVVAGVILVTVAPLVKSRMQQ